MGHPALNVTIAGERGVLTPTLTGAQPALYTLDGKTVRPLGQESDKTLALLNVLDDAQRKQAILSYHLADLVLGPGQDGKTIQPEGLKASAMNERQRAMLLDVISEWADIIHESAAAARMANLKQTSVTPGSPGAVLPPPSREKNHHLLPDSGPASHHRVRAATAGWRSRHARPHHVPRSYQRLRTEACGKMSKKLAGGLLIAVLATSESAHRVDEYLQATIFSVEKDQVRATMRLVPGIAVSSIVLAGIDTNADGVISEAEKRAYVERVLGDLSLTVDGNRLTPRLVSMDFPEVEEIKEGWAKFILSSPRLCPQVAATGNWFSKIITKRTLRLIW